MALDIEYVRERHPGRWIVLAIVIIILGLAGWYGYKWYTTGDLPFPLAIVSADSRVDESTVTSNQVKTYTVSAAHPRYITIPSLNLGNTRVFPVGLDSNNVLQSPSNINDAGWYSKSSTPGSGGVILIDGHNMGTTKDGAFAKLGTLKKGDKIVLERGDGRTFTYSVVDNQSMSIDEVNATGMTLMGKTAVPGKEALNLMTFDGKWVPRLGMFDRRIMVRTVIDGNTN
ncbi:MAG: Sortase family enzyme [Candidatus Saccharibacteria bacterium]|nr:Sortase family enzyme [Candidatus Saccharibacteria bacterium]